MPASRAPAEGGPQCVGVVHAHGMVALAGPSRDRSSPSSRKRTPLRLPREKAYLTRENFSLN